MQYAVYNMFSKAGNVAVHNVALQAIAHKKAHALTNEQAWEYFCDLLWDLGEQNAEFGEAYDTDVRDCAWDIHSEHFAY